jgi:hypothetical protein
MSSPAQRCAWLLPRAPSHNREALQIAVNIDAGLHTVSILAEHRVFFSSGAEHAKPET